MNERGNLIPKSQPLGVLFCFVFFLLQKKEPQALISEGSESVYRVNSFPQKVNHNQLVTWAHKISKQEKGFQTGNKQKSEFYTSTSQNIFSFQGPIAFPNF